MIITINRDSVCAGDDVFDHRITLELPGGASPKDLFKKLKKLHYFPNIAGNNVVWILTNKKHPFWIFSYFTKNDKLNWCALNGTIAKLDDGTGCFHLKYYWSPDKWKERIREEYGEDGYSIWHDGWQDEIDLCEKLSK